MADRFGARRVIILSLMFAVPFLALAPLFSGWWVVITIAAGGFLLQSTLPVNVTFAQTIAPISAATVSSLMIRVGHGRPGRTPRRHDRRSHRYRTHADVHVIHAAGCRCAGAAAARVVYSACARSPCGRGHV